MVENIGKVLGKKCNFKILNNQKNEISFQSLNFEKATKVLGWKSQYTFEEGIIEIFN